MTELAYTPECASLQRVVAGRYLLVREIGCGGMGIVFQARDVALDRPVAIMGAGVRSVPDVTRNLEGARRPAERMAAASRSLRRAPLAAPEWSDRIP